MMRQSRLQRRIFTAALVAAPALWLGTRAQPPATLRATPAQSEGPFYPVTLPKDTDFDLLRNGDQNYVEGQTAWIEGSIKDMNGKPVAGAQIEIWQCDQAGHYHHPGDGAKADKRFQGFGRVTVASDGNYRFRTLRPAPYGGRAPHIHVKVRLGQRELLTTQLYVAGDAGNSRDFLWRQLNAADRTSLSIPFIPNSDALLARFPIIVAI